MHTKNVALKAGMLVAAAAAMTFSSVANAGLQGNPLTVTATRDGFMATFSLSINDGSWSTDASTWTYNGPSGQTVQMRDTRPGMGNTLVAELDLGFFAIQYVEDPQINLNFNATNPGAGVANFTFTSALLTFAPIANADATASAGISLTDRNGPFVGNSATMTGLQGGGNSYKAMYNGANIFTQLVPTFSTVLPFQTLTSSGSTATTPIGTVSDMQAEFSFTLSGGDSATGTSTYIITPSPAGAALLGLFGVTVASRRRR